MGDNLPREAGEGLEILKSKKMYHTNTVHSSQNVLQKEGLLVSGRAFCHGKYHTSRVHSSQNVLQREGLLFSGRRFFTAEAGRFLEKQEKDRNVAGACELNRAINLQKVVYAVFLGEMRASFVKG